MYTYSWFTGLYSRNRHNIIKQLYSNKGFPGGLEVKASAWNAGDTGSIPGLGKCPGEGNGNPVHNSCLENPMDRGTWRAAVHGVTRVGHTYKHIYIYICMLSHLSSVRLCQAPLSKGFSRQEYWSWLPCPPPGDLPDPGIKPTSLISRTLAGGFFTTGATWQGQKGKLTSREGK